MLYFDLGEKRAILMIAFFLTIEVSLKLAHLFYLVLPDVHILFVLIFIGAEVFIKTL
jgi:hypothetical protein